MVEEPVVPIEQIDARNEGIAVIAVQVEIAAKLDEHLRDQEVPKRLPLFPAPRGRGAPGDRTVFRAGDVHQAISFISPPAYDYSQLFHRFQLFKQERNLCRPDSTPT